MPDEESLNIQVKNLSFNRGFWLCGVRFARLPSYFFLVRDSLSACRVLVVFFFGADNARSV
ncbi:hypothetical protein NB575_14250, partial [Vibrio parahaemolyticus]|uniref:hypothetical protein n=1 Tax=Vibrio parahaemolyticus TaxID=670 RepID=UPI00215C7578